MTEEQQQTSDYKLPNASTLQHVAKLSIIDDKPVMFDYWTSSCDKDVLIGVRDTMKISAKVKMNIRHQFQIYKVEEEYIIVTENLFI